MTEVSLQDHLDLMCNESGEQLYYVSFVSLFPYCMDVAYRSAPNIKSPLTAHMQVYHTVLRNVYNILN
jgi:hypothetical protein